MASIQTAIRLTDQMSAPIMHITNAMNMLLSAWDSVDSATSRGLDVSSVESIRSELHQATQAADQLGNEQEQFNNKVREGSSAVDGLASKLAGIVAGIGFAKIANDAVEFASDMVEVQNVVDVTFGNSAAKVDEWAKTTLESFGLNELSAKKYSGTMGAMLKSSGMTGDAVSDMSMRLAELSGDMASFYNLTNEEAFNKIRSGISGETEPLKQLGINMSVANLEAYALSHNMGKAYDKMTQAEQVQLRYNYLLEAANDSIGDYATNRDTSFAIQQKELSENFKTLIGTLASYVLPSLTAFFRSLNEGLLWMSENIEVVMPLMAGLLAIIGTYVTVLGIYNAVKAISATVEAVHAAKAALAADATLAQAAATTTATGAQVGFNAALLACPLTWTILLIIAVIAILIAVAAHIAKTGDVATTTFGVIAGALAVLGAFVINTVIGVVDGALQVVWSFITPFIGIIEWILNACRGGFDSFGGAVANLIGQIISWFLDLGKVVTKIIDAIFGTNWTEGLNNLQDKVLEWGKTETAITLNRDAPTVESWTRGDIQRIEYGDAYAAGAAWGDGISNKVSGMFGTEEQDPYLPEIEKTTGYIADSLDVTNEDLKYMRDLAEQETINRFTTAEVKVDLGGVTNNVNSNMDLDGVVDYLTTGVQEAMERIAEGVH